MALTCRLRAGTRRDCHRQRRRTNPNPRHREAVLAPDFRRLSRHCDWLTGLFARRQVISDQSHHAAAARCHECKARCPDSSGGSALAAAPTPPHVFQKETHPLNTIVVVLVSSSLAPPVVTIDAVVKAKCCDAFALAAAGTGVVRSRQQNGIATNRTPRWPGSDEPIACGKGRMPSKMPMMAITTSNSTSVNPRRHTVRPSEEMRWPIANDASVVPVNENHPLTLTVSGCRRVGDTGLEPVTPSLSSWCSNQLS
jgi:hypothetical protein